MQRFANGNHSALWDATTAIRPDFSRKPAIIPDRGVMQHLAGTDHSAKCETTSAILGLVLTKTVSSGLRR